MAPTDVPSLNQMGLLLWDGSKDAAGASEAFQRALQVDPLDPVLLSNYGRVLEESGGDPKLVFFFFFVFL